MKRNDKQLVKQQSDLLRKLLAQGGEIKLTQNINGDKGGHITTVYNGDLEATTTITDKHGKSIQFTTPEESPGVVTVNIPAPKMGKR